MIEQERLTAREAMALGVIRRHCKLTGSSPSARELGWALGIRSTRTAERYMERLLEKGLLKQEGSRYSIARRFCRLTPAHYTAHLLDSLRLLAKAKKGDVRVLPFALVNAGDGQRILWFDGQDLYDTDGLGYDHDTAVDLMGTWSKALMR